MNTRKVIAAFMLYLCYVLLTTFISETPVIATVTEAEITTSM